MTETTKAEIETLTAQVRVLMVGNRQVTASVADQLDVVPYDKINPFGRIRIKKEQKVIGECDGELVVSNIPAYSGYVLLVPEDRITLPRSVHTYWEKRCQFAVVEHAGVRVHIQMRESNGGWLPVDLGETTSLPSDELAYLESDVEEHKRTQAIRARFLSLPLIVLAGLR